MASNATVRAAAHSETKGFFPHKIDQLNGHVQIPRSLPSFGATVDPVENAVEGPPYSPTEIQ